MHVSASGGGNDGPLGADASWSDEMERNGEDKFNNEAPMMNNHRNNANNRNPRFVEIVDDVILVRSFEVSISFALFSFGNKNKNYCMTIISSQLRY